MRGILPEEIRTRTQIVRSNSAMYQILRGEWSAIESFLESSYLAKLGIIDKSLLIKEIRKAPLGACNFLPGLLRPVALEAWVRARCEVDKPEPKAYAQGTY